MLYNKDKKKVLRVIRGTHYKGNQNYEPLRVNILLYKQVQILKPAISLNSSYFSHMVARQQFAISSRMTCNKYFLAALINVHVVQSESSLSLWFWKEHLRRGDFLIERWAEGRGPETASTSIYRFVFIDIRELPEAWNESIQRQHIRNPLKYNNALATRTLFNECSPKPSHNAISV